jgi:cytochrome c biogenesis protein CcmG, thiol:disulfide interchange protein DsbE
MNLMKSLLLFLAITFTTSTFAQKTLPDVAVKTLEGETVNMRDFATNGKVTVLCFWATWCGPCKRELNTIAEIYPEWLEKYDVELLAITLDTVQRLGKAKSESSQWDFTILSDSNQDLQRALGFQNPPQTYVVDKNGHIVYEHTGYAPGDEVALEEAVKKANEGSAAEGH